MRKHIAGLLAGRLGVHLPQSDIERLIETPPQETLGDFAFPCFPLARALRKSPAAIANDLKEQLAHAPYIEKIEAVAGYCNFFIDNKAIAGRVLENAAADTFGAQSVSRRVVVEFSSPNTNKPLHLGHLRNMAIGESVSRILTFGGNSVVRTSINNDRGVHICKSMAAYSELGNNVTPQEKGVKSDHFVGDFYVLFSKKASEDPAWNDKALELLRKWEAHDGETVALWKTMNKWALDGFAQTYRLFDIAFDKEYYESEIYTGGREIILDGLERSVFLKRDDGAVYADLTGQGMDQKVLLRPDGTSVYIVQDLYLAVLKHNEFNYDLSLYVVGNEQEYHFAVLKALLHRLDNPLAEKIVHLSYGMVELPEGKMKSREGIVVDADDLIAATRDLAKAEVRERYALSDQDLEERSLRIALAAIKYQLLRVDIAKNMVFDPQKAIAFEGDTGPYLLYSYARASSIIRKAGDVPEAATPDALEPSEARLVKKIARFPDAVRGAYDKLSPSLIAAYGFELAQQFNEFYHACPVIGSDTAGFRLALVDRFRSVIKKCLWLLGIEEIEEM
ncbi:MAG: arginine--tRNA ligase [Chitinispirillaceae bacterium]|nr:arginine--tRNA ligase [Chitinispirillaceae bacterium]